jgi:hypothetical protein
MIEMTIRAASPAERLYANEQSSQIAGQCGSPGCLLGKFGADGMVFAERWSRDAPEFRAELGQVLETLRSDGQLLRSPADMSACCLDNPEGGLAGCSEYVFRADTHDYTYLIRCTPSSEDDHAVIYPYRRDYLEYHMKQAEKGIRFITPAYKELFRIPDGDAVRINRSDGTHIDRVCRYIDDCHVEVGHGWDSLFHICQFAEQMERCGNTVIPLRSSLPDKCYSVLPSGDEIIIVKKGESGYYHTGKYGHDRAEAQCIVDECNQSGGVTKAQEAAMLAGSMFGWAVPAADPKNYDAQGQPIKQRCQKRETRDER